MKTFRTTWRYLSTAVLAVAVAFSLVAISPAKPTQAYSGYQFPCAGYSVIGYSFGQWVDGWGYHLGEDVCSGAGNPVYAAADGVVMYSALTPVDYRWGNLILIQHDNGDGTMATSIYGHLANNRQVSAGQTVSKGQLIGFTGPANSIENGQWSAHLHFAIKTGPYNYPVGTYAPDIKGYRTNDFGAYAQPTNYVNGRRIVDDYQVVGVSGSGAYSKNAQYYVEFRLKNTGTSTWHINGSTPMRLGTTNPRDRESGFSNGEIGQGWAASSRIALMQDTAPGQVGTFRAVFSNRAVQPGVYAEHFAPVIEGQHWLADKDLWVQINVQPPRYTAQWVGQNVYANISPTNTANPQDPRYLTPGKVMNVKAYIKNVGDVPWTSSGPNPVRLGTSHPNDRASAVATGGNGSIPLSENWPWYTRPSNIDGRYDPGSNTITPTDTVQPGEIAVFSFTITAPNQPGDYIEYFNPLVEGVTWMNDLNMWFDFRVLPPGYHYEWVTQHNPPPIQLGRSSSTVSVDLRNSGQTSWPTGSTIRLGTWNGRDRTSAFSAGWLSPTRPSAIDLNVSNPADPIVHPGQVARFTFNVQTDTVPNGNYSEYVRPLAEGVQWFPEDYGIFVPVTVTSPLRDYKVVSQTFSRPVNNLKYGDRFTATLAIRNLGSEAWSAGGANPLRLGTARPNDRIGGFSDFSVSDPWVSPTRASNLDGQVTNLSTMSVQSSGTINQTGVAYFRVPLKVPNGIPPGAYNEYFNLVEENLTWLPDLGIFFPLYVTGG